MPYLPIQDHGIIGNMHTAALVGNDGCIDWFCHPSFDSPSVFGAILDDAKGGRFAIRPVQQAKSKQLYWPDTNVLVTRFFAASGVGQVTDFMPAGLPSDDPRRHWLVRRVEVMRGSVPFILRCEPAFDYARQPHRVSVGPGGALFESEGLTLALSTRTALEREGDAAVARFTLDEEGEAATFVLRAAEAGAEQEVLDEGASETLFRATVDYWRAWLRQCTYTGRWREMVRRSALVLKLLTYEPTGAIVAAPTCSLPEDLGGERNWDYRYTWIRDAAFTLYALMRVGFTEEAARFMGWLEQRGREAESGGALQVLYGLEGQHRIDEQVLGHLEGYCGSAPVRIGNGAYGQLQLDIYGELLDAAYLFNKYGTPISYDMWTGLRKIVDWVCDHWREPDEGIWEVRGGRRHFVYSKLMCWVAIDRGLRLAEKRSLPADRRRWELERDRVYEDIMAHGWSEELGAFVQHYGADYLDASVLMMPLVFFMSPTDPRMLSTLEAICRSPQDGGLLSTGLVYRYNVRHAVDGLSGDEGTFNICTFWLVEALTRAGRFHPEHLDRARLLFEQMLGYANHLGLYAEETGLHGEALGNFPQAFTHLALISAAFNLDRALGSRSPGP